jgi:GNAT superfamily N-acetyltransferase
VQYGQLQREEIAQILTIDRRELIERVYRLECGELRLELHHVDVTGWPPDTVAQFPLLYDTFDRGGDFFGAFDDEHLVGVAVLETIWRGTDGGLLQLELLHVGRDHRSRGVGVYLFEHARAVARECGARGLYISATPTENTIRFYQHRGCILIDTPDPGLYAREPEDIHLICPV